MPKKTTILILILALITGILLFLAVTENKQAPSPATVVPTKKPVEKTAKVFFNPQNIDLSTAASPSSSVDIMIDTGKAEAAGVQVELQYDPKALANVRLVPAADQSGFFGPTSTVLFNDVISETGRISYAIAISPGQAARRGVGKIATLSFQKAFNAPAATVVSFLDKTLVTILGENESVLKESLPLNITLTAQTTTAPFVPVTVFPTSTPSQ